MGGLGSAWGPDCARSNLDLAEHAVAMYFQFHDNRMGKNQGVGAYHAAKDAKPVEGFGSTSRIRSPWFQEQTPFPYFKGPNYTRPVFQEHSREGNFVAHPIVRMPSLQGFGQDPVAPSVPAEPVPSDTVPMATPASVCAAFKDLPDVYARCLKFNTRYATATAAQIESMNKELLVADAACQGDKNLGQWATCYYSHLESSWYENPLYLGGALLAGCAVVGLAILGLRTSEF